MTAETVRQEAGLAAIVAGYDAVVLDLWGVVHDGVQPYPGAVACLSALKAAGKPVALLSNAPRRAQVVVTRMSEMGIDRDLYGPVVSSGEITHQRLKRRDHPWYAALGRRAYMVGPSRDLSLIEETDIRRVERLDDADFLLVSGPIEDHAPLEAHEPLLDAAQAAGLALLCPNPDKEVIRGGVRILCAGAIAAAYAARGGEVRYEGKPFASAYRACLQAFGMPDTARLLVVGDSLETDLRGAANAGLDAVLVTGGIHAQALGIRRGEAADAARLADLLAAEALSPVAAVPAFTW